MDKPQSFVKRPVTVWAMKLERENVFEVAAWIREKSTTVIEAGEEGLVIYTLEGEMLAGWGDWVIQGIEGEFYPCKHSVFVQTYGRKK